MTDGELSGALDGLYAYDTGATDSGIHDEDLRERCIAALQERQQPGADQWRQWLARLVRDAYLSDEALARGYGLADALGFAEWLDERMGCPVP